MMFDKHVLRFCAGRELISYGIIAIGRINTFVLFLRYDRKSLISNSRSAIRFHLRDEKLWILQFNHGRRSTNIGFRVEKREKDKREKNSGYCSVSGHLI